MKITDEERERIHELLLSMQSYRPSIEDGDGVGVEGEKNVDSVCGLCTGMCIGVCEGTCQTLVVGAQMGLEDERYDCDEYYGDSYSGEDCQYVCSSSCSSSCVGGCVHGCRSACEESCDSRCGEACQFCCESACGQICEANAYGE